MLVLVEEMHLGITMTQLVAVARPLHDTGGVLQTATTDNPLPTTVLTTETTRANAAGAQSGADRLTRNGGVSAVHRRLRRRI